MARTRHYRSPRPAWHGYQRGSFGALRKFLEVYLGNLGSYSLAGAELEVGEAACDVEELREGVQISSRSRTRQRERLAECEAAYQLLLAEPEPDAFDLVEAEDRVQRAGSRLNRTLQTLTSRREKLAEARTTLAAAQSKLGDLQESGPITIAVTKQQVDLTHRFIRRLPGILGTRVVEPGVLEIMLRTSVRVEDALYDMGDFTITLAAERLRWVGYSWQDISDAFDVTCIRLPRFDYGPHGYYGEADVRLHHHYGTPHRLPNGQFTLRGGQFCVGSRVGDIREGIQMGEIEHAINVLVSCLNDSDKHHLVPDFGTHVEARHEKRFFTPTKSK